MKSISYSLIILVIGLFACGKSEDKSAATMDAKNENADQVMADKSSTAASLPTVAEIGLSKGEVQAIYMNYKQMTGYLLRSDGRLVQAAAEYMDEDMRGMKGSMAETIQAAVDQIKNTQDIELQRAQFEIISETLYPVVKVINPGVKLYWQNCPMAFNNKGANWLSESEAIKNPYFGDAMMSCGTTLEVIQ